MFSLYLSEALWIISILMLLKDQYPYDLPCYNNESGIVKNQHAEKNQNIQNI